MVFGTTTKVVRKAGSKAASSTVDLALKRGGDAKFVYCHHKGDLAASRKRLQAPIVGLQIVAPAPI